jgi:hypothetical protein
VIRLRWMKVACTRMPDMRGRDVPLASSISSAEVSDIAAGGALLCDLYGSRALSPSISYAMANHLTDMAGDLRTCRGRHRFPTGRQLHRTLLDPGTDLWSDTDAQ